MEDELKLYQFTTSDEPKFTTDSFVVARNEEEAIENVYQRFGGPHTFHSKKYIEVFEVQVPHFTIHIK